MNNNTNNASTDHHHWLHYYQQTTPAPTPAVMITSVGASSGTDNYSDTTSTIVTTSFTTKITSSPNKSNSLGNIDVHLNPQASVGKPIRRRSRAPRKNPTTLLNASTTNFRSLVQQFTGCQNAKASSFGSRKGPVNLSFGMPRNHNDQYITSTNIRIAPTGSDYYNNQLWNPVVDHDEHQGKQWQQQETFEKLQINNKKNMMQQSVGVDEFAIDDLQQLIDESSSFSTIVNKQDGNYYF